MPFDQTTKDMFIDLTKKSLTAITSKIKNEIERQKRKQGNT